MEAKEEVSFCLPPSGDIMLPCFVQKLRVCGPPVPREHLTQPLFRKRRDTALGRLSWKQEMLVRGWRSFQRVFLYL